MSYDKIIKDLEICGKGEACTGCSMEKNDREDCYRTLMMAAASEMKASRDNGVRAVRALLELIRTGESYE